MTQKKHFLWCDNQLLWNRSLVVNTACSNNGRILILDTELNDTNFLLVNFYNSSSESEQLCTFSTLQKPLEKFDDYNQKNIVFGGDFDLIFD